MGILELLGGGVRWAVERERDDLLPGRLCAGTVRFTPSGTIEARGLVAALIATEQWQYDETTRDGQGNMHTRTVTRTAEHRRLPVMLRGPASYTAGLEETVEFEVPVPPLGPATFEGTVSRLTWELEIKLDVPGLDPAATIPVRVLQPTALLRAGAVRVGQFALFDSADVAAGAMRGAIVLDPVPVCIGAPFGGGVRLDGPALELQEIRAELIVEAEATVSSGRTESVTLWSARLAAPGRHGDGEMLTFEGSLPDRMLPTVELPHGRSAARFDVTLARAWALDDHLVRDVAVCSTVEL